MGIGGTAEIEMVTLRSLQPDCLLWGSAASIVYNSEDDQCATSQRNSQTHTNSLNLHMSLHVLF